jgi:hypothetical protein
VLFRRSTDGGTSFERPIRLNSSTPIQDVSEVRIVSSPASGRLVLVTWLDSHLCLRSNWSTAAGQAGTFQSSDVSVSPTCLGGKLFLAHDTAVDDAGNVFVASSRIDDLETAREQVLFHAFDGARWSPDETVLTSDGSGASYAEKGAPLVRPAIGVAGSRLLVVWTQSFAPQTDPKFEPDYDIHAIWSTDSGASWSSPTQVTSKTSDHQRLARSASPALLFSASGGEAFIVWDDRRNWTAVTHGSPFGDADDPIGAPDIYFNRLTFP